MHRTHLHSYGFPLSRCSRARRLAIAICAALVTLLALVTSAAPQTAPPACSTSFSNFAWSASGLSGPNLCAPAATPCSALQNAAQTSLINAQQQAAGVYPAVAPSALSGLGQVQGCLNNIFNTGLSLSLFNVNPMEILATLACNAIQSEWSQVEQMLSQYQYAYEWPGFNLAGISIPGGGVSVSTSRASFNTTPVGSGTITKGGGAAAGAAGSATVYSRPSGNPSAAGRGSGTGQPTSLGTLLDKLNPF